MKGEEAGYVLYDSTGMNMKRRDETTQKINDCQTLVLGEGGVGGNGRMRRLLRGRRRLWGAAVYKVMSRLETIELVNWRATKCSTEMKMGK